MSSLWLTGLKGKREATASGRLIDQEIEETFWHYADTMAEVLHKQGKVDFTRSRKRKVSPSEWDEVFSDPEEYPRKRKVLLFTPYPSKNPEPANTASGMGQCRTSLLTGRRKKD